MEKDDSLNNKNTQNENDNNVPITKKQNKKFTSGDNTKYYLFAALGILNLIPVYFILKKKNSLVIVKKYLYIYIYI